MTLNDDEIFERYKQQRIKELTNNYNTIETEQDLIHKTKTETMIVHFYKDTFSTCKMMNKELEKLSKLFTDINFYKVDASICPIVCNKLGISVLPFLGFFKNGFFVDQVVGFEGMGDERFDFGKLKDRIGNSNIYKNV